MSVMDEVYKRIKEEIENDPAKRGYKGKTDVEVMALLNSNFQTQEIINRDNPPRIQSILMGLSATPNILSDTKDVTEANKVTLDAVGG